MPSVLVSSSQGAGAPPLASDLTVAGFTTIPLSARSSFVHDVIKHEADLVVCFELLPDAAFFEDLANLARLAPRPVLVFTTDPDADKIALAMQSGIHAYVVGGYGRERLRSLIQLARARFQSDRSLRQELAEISQRFAERKLVDRAKGILMGARQLREDEAFRALRSAAMASKQRIGQLSQMVINAASFAEAMNRAGLLRMLSQRLVKLYALACTNTMPEDTAARFAQSIARVEENLAILGRILSKPTLGDLISSLAEPWPRFRAMLAEPASVARLGDIDALAEEMLQRAERLTTNLEVAAFAAALRVINVSGRQRMLSQRLAKQALMASLVGDGPGPREPQPELATLSEFAQGLAYLEALPLSNAKLRFELDQALEIWRSFHLALDQAASSVGRVGIAVLSEQLLEHFDQLTDELERAMQALVG